MPLYTSIGGVRKEIASLYTGIDGVKKEIQSMYSGNDGVKETIFSAGIPLSELPVGTEILIYEERSNSAVWGSSGYYSYIIISHDYPEENTTLAMRKLIPIILIRYYKDGYYGSSNVNNHVVSHISRLSQSVQSYLKEVDWDDNGNIITRSAVILSEEEVSKDGLEYFNGLSSSELNARRKAKMNGLNEERSHFLRDKITILGEKGSITEAARAVSETGGITNSRDSSVRVVLALSSHAKVVDNILK